MLELRGVSKRYSGSLAVDAVSFAARPGEITGYLGPNGSGKSTTIKMIAGLIDPTAGEILFGDVPIYIALGWAAVFFIPSFAEGAQRFDPGIAIAVLVLVAAGGVLYTLGGVVYGLKRPDPSPRWFGFHEVFHSFTILAFVTHYVGVSLATYSLR